MLLSKLFLTDSDNSPIKHFHSESLLRLFPAHGYRVAEEELRKGCTKTSFQIEKCRRSLMSARDTSQCHQMCASVHVNGNIAMTGNMVVRDERFFTRDKNPVMRPHLIPQCSPVIRFISAKIKTNLRCLCNCHDNLTFVVWRPILCNHRGR